ncbi:hypothetical protein QEN19_001116 [Hanseniaspora menglaensis]
MFKDIRLKKHQNTGNGYHSPGKVLLTPSPPKNNNQMLSNMSPANLITNNNSIGRKSVDSDTSLDSMMNGVPTIKGTLTHEWGSSSTKQKNKNIIKLNNEDGTPLTSPIKLSTTQSPSNTFLDDFKQEEYDVNQPKIESEIVIDKKRKINRAARILSNDQFLNIDIFSPEDRHLIEKINNGKIYESPNKKRNDTSEDILLNKISNIKASDTGEEDNYTVSFISVHKSDIEKAAEHRSSEPYKKGYGGRARSVSTTESINSEASDVSETSQFSFQFPGRNASVKYYSKNTPKPNEMQYFEDVYEHEDGMEEDENSNIYDDDDDEDDEFGNGFSTIAQITDDDCDNEVCDEDTFNESFLSKNSTSNTLSYKESDILNRTYVGLDELNIEEENEDEEDLLTPIANDGKITNFNDLFDISDGSDHDLTSEESDHNTKTPIAKKLNVSVVKSYNDFFDLSDPDEGCETSENFEDDKGTGFKKNKETKPKSYDELKDYTKDTDLERLLEEIDESLENDGLSSLNEASGKEELFKVTSPLFSTLLKSPKLIKKNFGYTQFYGKNSIADIRNNSLSASNSDSTKLNVSNFSSRNTLKYHDLSSNLDSTIPRRMGELFFIDEEEEEELLIADDHLNNQDDDTILDEINNIPEDYDDEEEMVAPSNASRVSFRHKTPDSNGSNYEKCDYNGNLIHEEPKELFGFGANILSDSGSVSTHSKTKTQKYYKLFNKGNSLIAKNDKPQSNKMSIKSKTITFFKRQGYTDNSCSNKTLAQPVNNLEKSRATNSTPRNISSDLDLSPIQERRGSIEG